MYNINLYQNYVAIKYSQGIFHKIWVVYINAHTCNCNIRNSKSLILPLLGHFFIKWVKLKKFSIKTYWCFIWVWIHCINEHPCIQLGYDIIHLPTNVFLLIIISQQLVPFFSCKCFSFDVFELLVLKIDWLYRFDFLNKESSPLNLNQLEWTLEEQKIKLAKLKWNYQ